MRKRNLILSLGIVFTMICCHDGKDKIQITGVSPAESLTDMRDGHVYKCLNIGGQIWMAENLKYRLPKGVFDGCYTFGEKAMSDEDIEIDYEKFSTCVTEAIEDGRIIDPPGLPVFRQPTRLLPIWLRSKTPVPTIINTAIASSWSDIAVLLQNFYDELLNEAVEIQAALHYLEAEQENGGYSDNYGLLYDYDGAMLAVPEGWRLPTDEDWMKLEKHLGMQESELTEFDRWRGQGLGLLLKNGEEGIGFNVQYAGCSAFKPQDGMNYIRKNEGAYFWCSTLLPETDSTQLGIIRSIVRFDDGIMRTTTRMKGYNACLYSVRCIKKED